VEPALRAGLIADKTRAERRFAPAMTHTGLARRGVFR